MSKYLFVLGKDQELSLAELHAAYPEAVFLESPEGFALLELDRELNRTDLDRLGGIVKMAQVLGECEREDLERVLFGHIFSSKEEGKIEYGLSLYGWSEKNLRPLLLDLKQRFKNEGVNSRFANQDFLNLSAAQYKGLRSRGEEWLAAKGGQGFLVARVLAVQNIDAYSRRDYEKPFRSMEVGMLPPKLAQILLNLAQAKPGDLVWDPFCGGGVLLMEGVLMGCPMLGSDINAETLAGAQQNLEWLASSFGAQAEFSLFRHDATQPLAGQRPDAIACEGYLGPPQRRPFDERRQAPLLRELEALYAGFFKALQAIDFRGPVVIALPFFRSDHKEIHLEGALAKIAGLGFVAEPLLPDSPKNHLLYARPDQWVGRRIMRWRLA